MTEITIDCCEGLPEKSYLCIGSRCPNYQKAEDNIEKSWPYVGTGYGNLHGNPTKSLILDEVRKTLGVTKPKTTVDLLSEIQTQQTDLRNKLVILPKDSIEAQEIRRQMMINRLGINGLRSLNNKLRYTRG